jgi:hypothetical protein
MGLVWIQLWEPGQEADQYRTGEIRVCWGRVANNTAGLECFL